MKASELEREEVEGRLESRMTVDNDLLSRPKSGG